MPQSTIGQMKEVQCLIIISFLTKARTRDKSKTHFVKDKQLHSDPHFSVGIDVRCEQSIFYHEPIASPNGAGVMYF